MPPTGRVRQLMGVDLMLTRSPVRGSGLTPERGLAAAGVLRFPQLQIRVEVVGRQVLLPRVGADPLDLGLIGAGSSPLGSS